MSIFISETYDKDGQLLLRVTRPRTPDDDAKDLALANGMTLRQKAQQALTTNATFLAKPDPTAGNNTYLGHATVPNGTLTTAQLSPIVRLLSDQVDALTRQLTGTAAAGNEALVAQLITVTKQNNALIRLALNLLDDTTGT